MKPDDSLVIRAAPWAIPLLTIGVFVFDLVTPVGIAVSILYAIPLLLTVFRSSERESFYFCGLATCLLWVGLFLEPPGSSLLYGVINRTLGTGVLWVLALGLIRLRRLRHEAVQAEDKLMSERVERAHAEALMMAAQEARAYADTASLGAAVSRREAEEKLHISQQRLESIIASAMDAVITVDESQTIVLFNRAAEQMFGLSSAESLGQPLERFLPARFRDVHRHHVQGFGQSGVTSRKMGHLGTVMGLRSNGEEFPIEAAISHIAIGQQKYYTVILRDITERKQAEIALTETTERWQLLMQYAPAALAMLDRDLHYLAVSQRWINDYRLEGKILIGKSHYEVFPEIPERWKVVHQRGLAGEVVRCEEDRFVRRDGSEQWLRWEVRPWYTIGGAVGGLVFFTEDITGRKRAEHLLRQSEERYRRLIAVSPYAIVVIRGDRILFANDQALRLFGAVKAEEILERPRMDLFHPDSHAVLGERIHELLEGRAEMPMLEEKIVTLDGRSVDVEVSAARFVDEEEPAILVMLRDISERKRLQAQLRRTERVAELGTLASGMAHEIGTPMNVILGRAEYLMDRVKEEPIRKGLQTIVSQVERITRVMNQLLAFARRKSPERVPVVMGNIIEDNVELFQERLRKNGITAELTLDGNCRRVLADPDQMSQVFINLVMNAVHAMPEGGRLRIGLASEQEQVKLTVTDTGHGIPKEVVNKIFEPFFTTKEFGQGTGLGLTVVKGIIEEHQGSITVESDEGKGTTFTILLPTSSSS